MTAKQWAGLTDIEVVSGTAEDPDGSFRGFVTVRAVAEDGSMMAGQLHPEEVRLMALNFFGAAEAADQDAIVFRLMTRDLGVEAEDVAGFVMRMREERRQA